MIILKLGGSLITDKSKKFVAREDVLSRVSAEIKRGAKGEIIIVHGGGSFGHPVADKYRLNKGFQDKGQIEGITLTRQSMGRLNEKVVDAMIDAGIPAVAIQPSSNITCNYGRIDGINIGIIKGFLKLGMVPVLYGDVVLDRGQGFCILSGDQLVTYLAEELKAGRVILATDVDGVFDKDPKKFKDAKLIEEISKTNRDVLEKLEPLLGDVTGGIKGKIMELIRMADEGIESRVVNAMVDGRLEKALSGEKVKGTMVV